SDAERTGARAARQPRPRARLDQGRRAAGPRHGGAPRQTAVRHPAAPPGRVRAAPPPAGASGPGAPAAEKEFRNRLLPRLGRMAEQRNNSKPLRNGGSAKRAAERAAAKPQALEVIADGIPAALRERPQWVCWKYERRRQNDGAWVWTKVPVRAANGRNAKAND